MIVTREKLYEEVWAEPMTTVAKRYEVSSNYLARVCEQLDVPRPTRGYWQQRAVGAEVEQPPLPEAEPGADLEWARDGTEPRRQPMIAKATEKSRAPRDKHPLLEGVRGHFDHAYSGGHDNHYVRPYRRNLVDVLASSDGLGRALKMTNALFLALEERGHRVVLAPRGARFCHRSPEVREGYKRHEHEYRSAPWSPDRATVVIVGDVSIGISVFEASEEVEAKYDWSARKHVRVEPRPAPKVRSRGGLAPVTQEWTSKAWLPSGRLGVHLYAPYSGVQWERYWFESKRNELAAFFEDIATHLKRGAPEVARLLSEEERRQAEEQRKWEAERLKEERRQAEEERRRQEQRHREEQLRKEKAFEGNRPPKGVLVAAQQWSTVRRGGNGMAPRRGREFWQGVVADLEGSGLTHEEFASRRRVNVGSLRSWLYRLRREGGAGVRLLPVRVEGSTRSLEVIEIGIAGAVVRLGVGTDVAYVAELVTQLRERC